MKGQSSESTVTIVDVPGCRGSRWEVFEWSDVAVSVVPGGVGWGSIGTTGKLIAGITSDFGYVAPVAGAGSSPKGESECQ